MKQFLRALGLSAALGATTVALAPSADAAPGCTGSYLICVYQFHDYEGGKLLSSNDNFNWDYAGNPYALRFMNDKMSSIQNPTGRTYTVVAQHDHLDGYNYCMPPASSRPNVSNSIENKSSSHDFFTGC